MDVPVMVAVSASPPSAQASGPDFTRYLEDLGFELAQLSLSAGCPEASLHFLQAVAALRRSSQGEPGNAAPGDAA